jgi:hypothetical protein
VPPHDMKERAGQIRVLQEPASQFRTEARHGRRLHGGLNERIKDCVSSRR